MVSVHKLSSNTELQESDSVYCNLEAGTKPKNQDSQIVDHSYTVHVII